MLQALPSAAIGSEATLRRVAELGRERDELATLKAEAERAHLQRIACAWELGAIDMDLLAAAYYEFREVADQGYCHRWDAIVPVPSSKVVGYARWRPQRAPNGPNGSWCGRYPFDDGPTPSDATSVTYILFDEEQAVCYIGSTAGFRGRMNRHARDGKCFKSWRAYPCPDRRVAYDLEARLIREHQPYLNKTRRG